MKIYLSLREGGIDVDKIFIYAALIATTAAMMWGMFTGISMMFSGAKDCRGECIVLPVSGHMEDVELRIREAVSQARRLGLRGAVVYVADFGADSETAEIAERMCGEFGVTQWVNRRELADRIEENLKDK